MSEQSLQELYASWAKGIREIAAQLDAPGIKIGSAGAGYQDRSGEVILIVMPCGSDGWAASAGGGGGEAVLFKPHEHMERGEFMAWLKVRLMGYVAEYQEIARILAARNNKTR